jgi:hypothetical protein
VGVVTTLNFISLSIRNYVRERRGSRFATTGPGRLNKPTALLHNSQHFVASFPTDTGSSAAPAPSGANAPGTAVTVTAAFDESRTETFSQSKRGAHQRSRRPLPARPTCRWRRSAASRRQAAAAAAAAAVRRVYGQVLLAAETAAFFAVRS